MLVAREVPPGRLGPEVDEEAGDDGGDGGAGHHEAPSEAGHAVVWDVEEGEVGDVAELWTLDKEPLWKENGSYHDPERCPHLPLLRGRVLVGATAGAVVLIAYHGQGAPDFSRRALRRKYSCAMLA